jgi:osmoprotectant transport system ATP-binding protein
MRPTVADAVRRCQQLYTGGRVLELVGVSKRFGATIALHPTSLRLGPGETIALVGESGSGKSTLLRLAIGLLTPDAGTVRFDGAPLSREVRHRFGYVIQGGGLFPHLTARENLGLLPREVGWAHERIDARIGELAALARMPSELLARFPAQLSGGQRQRVSLMRALMLDPDVLLLDEPLGALDPVTRAELQDELRALFRSMRKAVVLVTHDLGEAAYLTGQLVLMKDGRVLQRGPLAELTRAPADPYVTRFVAAQRGRLEGAT